MKILVTGAQGFVGRYYVAHVLRGDPAPDVLGVGRSARDDSTFTHSIRLGPRPVPAPVPLALREHLGSNRYRYASIDLRDTPRLAELLGDFGPDIVVHMASGLRDDDASHLYGTNVLGTISLLQAIAASARGGCRVVCGSSGGVYGAPKNGSLPLDETAACDPLDLYSASKLAAEQATRIVAQRAGIPVVQARLFNLLGPGQDERHVCGRFASQAAAIAIGSLPSVIEAGNLEATRDFIDVRDAARGIDLLTQKGTPGTAYNVGSGAETMIGDVLRKTLVAAGVDKTATIVQLPPREGDIPRHFARVKRLAALGFEVERDLATSIGDIVEYYMKAAGAS